MPAATTHVEFAKDVLRLLDSKHTKLIQNKPMFYLGSQGPDMLFFSKASILPGSLKKYGDLMHDEKCDEAIQYFDKYSENDPDLRSYFYGFLCHYALDSTAHPLINAVARDTHNQTGMHEGAAHVTSEANIDVWMLHQRGRTEKSYDVFRYMQIDKVSKSKLGLMYAGMFQKVYNLTIKPSALSQAATEVVQFTKFLYPTKLKYNFLCALEKQIKIPPVLSGVILYDKHDFKVVNIERKTYPLSYDSTQSISASFPMLYAKAINVAKRLIDHRSADDFLYNFNGEPYHN